MPNNTFPREVRLIHSGDYDRVFGGKPIRVTAKGIVILALPNGLEHSRLGLVVPKKVVRRAVGRNRIKRLVRESFRQSKDLLPAADLVVLARPGIGEIPNAEISSALSRLWANISRRSGSQQS